VCCFLDGGAHISAGASSRYCVELSVGPYRQLLRVITTRWAKRTESAIVGDLAGGSRLDSCVQDINCALSLPPSRALPCFCHLRVHAQVSATISSSPSSRRCAASQLRSRLWSAPRQDLAPSFQRPLALLVTLCTLSRALDVAAEKRRERMPLPGSSAVGEIHGGCRSESGIGPIGFVVSYGCCAPAHLAESAAWAS
jgi:hypothetical protein